MAESQCEMIEALPLFHRLHGQKILVQGSGEAAEAKIRLIEEAGGEVVREPEPGVRLAFIALAEGAEAAAQALKAAGLLVNVVDRPELCDFTVPAIVDRSPVVVGIGTGGASASLSKALKERLEIILPIGLGTLGAAIRQQRQAVANVHRDVPARREFWSRLLAPGAPLDPLAQHENPADAILTALADGIKPEHGVFEIRIGADGANGLTLRELRLMAQADLVVHAGGIGPEILALVRRDAARQLGTEVPEGATGRIVLIRPA